MGVAGWKSVEEIAAYRFAVTLRDEIFRLTSTGPAATDFPFRNQIRDSAASVARNLSEGFERYFHPEFAYFAGIAKGSLGETITSLDDARARNYLSADDHHRLRALAERARRATSGLLKHLRSSQAPGEIPPRRTKHR